MEFMHPSRYIIAPDSFSLTTGLTAGASASAEELCTRVCVTGNAKRKQTTWSYYYEEFQTTNSPSSRIRGICKRHELTRRAAILFTPRPQTLKTGSRDLSKWRAVSEDAKIRELSELIRNRCALTQQMKQALHSGTSSIQVCFLLALPVTQTRVQSSSADAEAPAVRPVVKENESGAII